MIICKSHSYCGIHNLIPLLHIYIYSDFGRQSTKLHDVTVNHHYCLQDCSFLIACYFRSLLSIFINTFYTFRFYPVVFVLAFSFISVVMLTNVLIAQLSNIYPEAQRKAKIAANINRAWIVANIERKWLYNKLLHVSFWEVLIFFCNNLFISGSACKRW